MACVGVFCLVSICFVVVGIFFYTYIEYDGFYFSGPETETWSCSIYIHNKVEGKWDFQSAAQW